MVSPVRTIEETFANSLLSRNLLGVATGGRAGWKVGRGNGKQLVFEAAS
jgi:hypothetical protein